MKTGLWCLALFVGSFTNVFAQLNVPLKFDFGPGKVKEGYTQILPETTYTSEKGYGFWPGASLNTTQGKKGGPLESDFISSNKPFYFSINLPDGNYDVKVIFGDKKGTSSQTVRAESRRFMLQNSSTETGRVEKKKFTVHMHGLSIGNTDKKVLITPREVDFFHWDNQLTLEFNGTESKICGLEIKRNYKAVTVFLAGNSTVVDQDKEPWAAWGQMIPVFFKPGKVSIANYAESGETLLAFKRELRLEKIWSLAKPGDYLFIEFGHNDQKTGPNHLDPFTSYKETLIEWVAEARKRKIIPVLVTSMGRRSFTPDGKPKNTLGDYPEAVRQAGKEAKVPVIDLNRMSMTLYEAWGPVNSAKGFVDGSHANVYGAWQLAKCIAEGIRQSVPGLATYLLPEFKKTFDPAKPDPFTTPYWPLSPQVSNVKPPGS
ncbi:MAG: rhamnogalacturonan acetylesterase [Sphingobacteriaceae bacterium]|nr:rhamnogalacturonan acetylesterase [Sphingobacteriaceae bacterium]